MSKIIKIITPVIVFFSIITLSLVSYVNSQPQTARADTFSNTKTNTIDSWLAITNASPNYVEGYFCVKREAFFGSEEPIELSAYVEGDKVGYGVDTNYNSMNPYEKNCDSRDRNSFRFNLEYTNNCRYDDIYIAVKSEVYNQTNVVSKLVDNPYCNNSSNNNSYNSNNNNVNVNSNNTYYNNSISANGNQYSNQTLKINNCVEGNSHRVPKFEITSGNANCFGNDSSYVAQTNLSQRYLHVAVCQNTNSNLAVDNITRIDTSNSNANRNLCGYSQNEIDYYSVDLKNANYLTISECVYQSNDDGLDVVPSIVPSKSYSNNFNNCTGFYNNRNSVYNYSIKI